MKSSLPVGKLPANLLGRLLEKVPANHPRLVLGPGIGLDCAVIDYGDTLLAIKSDPITFVTDQIGWYAVQVNSNDIATSGATPRWFLATLLLPEGLTTEETAETIFAQVIKACEDIEVTVIGGHTEITYGIDRPIVVGMMIGEVERGHLVTPKGAKPGDRVLVSKGVPIEATAILAREFPAKLEAVIGADELRQAADFLYQPGISILRDVHLALTAGQVTSMHDPTEGGLLSALWELADASGRSFYIDLGSVPVPTISGRICQALKIDPFGAIASGSLLLTAPEQAAENIRRAWEAEGIPCAEIGWVDEGPPQVYRANAASRELIYRPERDEIARLFQAYN